MKTLFLNLSGRPLKSFSIMLAFFFNSFIGFRAGWLILSLFFMLPVNANSWLSLDQASLNQHSPVKNQLTTVTGVGKVYLLVQVTTEIGLVNRFFYYQADSWHELASEGISSIAFPQELVVARNGDPVILSQNEIWRFVAGQWLQVWQRSSENEAKSSLTVDRYGVPFAVFIAEDALSLTVHKYVEGLWVPVGDDVTLQSNSDGNSPNIFAYGAAIDFAPDNNAFVSHVEFFTHDQKEWYLQRLDNDGRWQSHASYSLTHRYKFFPTDIHLSHDYTVRMFAGEGYYNGEKYYYVYENGDWVNTGAGYRWGDPRSGYISARHLPVTISDSGDMYWVNRILTHQSPVETPAAHASSYLKVQVDGNWVNIAEDLEASIFESGLKNNRPVMLSLDSFERPYVSFINDDGRVEVKVFNLQVPAIVNLGAEHVRNPFLLESVATVEVSEWSDWSWSPTYIELGVGSDDGLPLDGVVVIDEAGVETALSGWYGKVAQTFNGMSRYYTVLSSDARALDLQWWATTTPNITNIGAEHTRTALDLDRAITLQVEVWSGWGWTPNVIGFGFTSNDGLPLDGIEVLDTYGNAYTLSGWWDNINQPFFWEPVRLVIPAQNRKIEVEWWAAGD